MTLDRARFGLGISNCRKASSVVEGIRKAEEVGAEIAFVAEDINCRDAFELCAVAATRTSRIRLATGVVNPYTRNPTSLAMAVSTLDEISGGRAVLGLGTSSPALVEVQMGIPFGKQVRVMREATEIIRRLLDGEIVSYSGERFAFTNAHLDLHPVQKRIPIFFAAMGPLMLRLAGRLADGVLLNVGASVEYARRAVSEIQAASQAAGRLEHAVTVAAWLSTYITDDYDAGLLAARKWLATMLSIPLQGELLLEGAGLDTSILLEIRQHVGGYPHWGDREAAARHVPPEVAERLALIGSVEKVRQRVGEYRAAGVDLPIFGPTAVQELFGP